MQSIEEKKNYNFVIKKTCYVTDLAYLALHIVYMILFLIAKQYTLVWINLISIVIYSIMPILLKFKKYYIYALICGNEFLIFMSVFTLLCGFSSGFHLCIVGMSVVSFFTVYFSKRQRNVGNAIIWSVLSVILYLSLHFYCSFNNPTFVLDKWLVVTLFTIHSIVVFMFITLYLLIFLKFAIKLENNIITQSRIDNLTQIPNRYDLYNYLDSIDDRKDYLLAIFDIDDFKKINDKYGHLCGDYILKEVADISKGYLYNAFVSRYGGEEFIVIYKIEDDVNDVLKIFDDFRIKIQNTEFVYNNTKIHLTITIGIKKYHDDINNETWIEEADENLYEGKKLGKNTIIF